MKLLISLPYSNSQWVYQVLKTHHRYHLSNTTILLPQFKSQTLTGYKYTFTPKGDMQTDWKEEQSDFACDNFLDDSYKISGDNFWDTSKEIKEPLIQSKIRWIEMSKRIGLDVCYNVETSNLVGNAPMCKDWFKNFYRQNQTLFYVLLNKDLWSHWIRFLFFTNLIPKLNEKLKYKAKPVDFTDFVLNTRSVWNVDLIKAYINEYKIKFYYDKEIWKLFLVNLRFLHEEIIGLKGTPTDRFFKKEILWLEDLSIESLQLKFDCPSPLQNNLGNSKLKFENYFSKEANDFMKKQFAEYMQKEFVYYGYPLGKG